MKTKATEEYVRSSIEEIAANFSDIPEDVLAVIAKVRRATVIDRNLAIQAMAVINDYQRLADILGP